MSRYKRHKRHTNVAEKRMENFLENLSEFQAFLKDVPMELRKAILNGDSPDALYQKFSHIAAVRAIQIAFSEPDSGKALAAAKEILDRSQGRATEKKEVRHKFDHMSEEELDAILVSEETQLLEELEDDDEEQD